MTTNPTPASQDELDLVDFLGSFERAKGFEERHQVRLKLEAWIERREQALLRGLLEQKVTVHHFKRIDHDVEAVPVSVIEAELEKLK